MEWQGCRTIHALKDEVLPGRRRSAALTLAELFAHGDDGMHSKGVICETLMRSSLQEPA